MSGMWSNLNDIIKAKTMTPDCLVNKIVDEFRRLEKRYSNETPAIGPKAMGLGLKKSLPPFAISVRI